MSNNIKDSIGKQSSIARAGNDNVVHEGIDILQIPNPAHCLRCVDLLDMTIQQLRDIEAEWGISLYSNMPCHFTKGGTLCPAKNLRIIKYSDIEKAVSAYMEAFLTGDNNKMQVVIRSISQKDGHTEQLVMARIQEEMKNHFQPNPKVAGELSDSTDTDDELLP